MLVHLRNKLYERYLAVHEYFTRPSAWCAGASYALECHTGCIGFSPNSLLRSTAEQEELRERTLDLVKDLSQNTSAERKLYLGLYAGGFCNGGQKLARWCGIRISPVDNCCGLTTPTDPATATQSQKVTGVKQLPISCAEVVDLLPSVHSAAARQRMRLAKSKSSGGSLGLGARAGEEGAFMAYARVTSQNAAQAGR